MKDQAIIALFFDRREDAISETKAKYGEYLFSLSYHILKNREDAEECENDTYLAAWEKIPPARPKILSAFLAKITRNISLNKLREQNTQKRGGKTITLPLSELVDSIPDSDALSAMQPEALADSLNAFLKTLSSTERRVFILHYWYSESIEEIANKYGFGKSKVKMMLKRTRDKLQNHLQKEGIL